MLEKFQQKEKKLAGKQEREIIKEYKGKIKEKDVGVRDSATGADLFIRVLLDSQVQFAASELGGQIIGVPDVAVLFHYCGVAAL